jgi:hypothetical protein
VAHDRRAGLDDRAGPLGHLAAALELDRVAARLLDEPVGSGDRLLVGGLVAAERQVADHQRRPEAAADGAGEHQQLVHRDRDRVAVAEHVVGGRIADEHDVDAGVLDDQGARVVVGGDHDDRLAQRALLGELEQGDRLALLLVTGWGGHGRLLPGRRPGVPGSPPFR